MPRPSLKKERTQEILDAFERCVARLGLEATSLEAIAEEAGMQRSILRHYIGNRDAIIAAMIDRITNRYRAETKQLLGALPKSGKTDALIDLLFNDDEAESLEQRAVTEALLAAAGRYPVIRERFSTWMTEFVDVIARILAEDHPHAGQGECWTVAYGLVGLYFTNDAMAPLALPRRFNHAAQASARRLAATLLTT